MIIIIIALAIIGFVFPPAWLALLGYGIYVFASRKSRRNDAVESRVKKMVAAGKGSASFSDLYFEAARSYAIEKGAKAPEPNAASAHILVDGTKYFVVFSKAVSGGTMISVEESDVVKHRIFDEFINNSSGVKSDTDAVPYDFNVGGFSFYGDILDDKMEAKVVSQIARRVIEMCPTELDLYRYLMEESDRMSEGDEIEKHALEKSRITPLEYEGEMTKSHDYPDNRAALNYLNDEVSPDLEEVAGYEIGDKIRALIFTYIVDLNVPMVNELRKRYAVHYANNCTQNGHFGFADKWDDVINSIP